MPAWIAKKLSLNRCGECGCFLYVFVSALILASGMTALEDPATSPSLARQKCNSEWRGIKLKFIAFDFDGTCTTKDTTSLYYRATEQYRNPTETKNLDRQWEELGSFYIQGYHETIRRLLANTSSAVSGELNLKGLKAFLKELHVFESASTKRVEESGLLAGITMEGINQVAGEVQLQPGCVNVLNQLKLPLYIISFNWSEDLIRVVLNGQVKNINITANNFPFQDNKSTGDIGERVSKSGDKEKEFERLLQTQGESEGFTVYIGDSIGDLLPLLKANVGIVIGNNSLLRSVSKAFGIKLIALSNLIKTGNCGIPIRFYDSDSYWCGNDRGTLYETDSWDEIGELLLGKKPPNNDSVTNNIN